jgi:hypothetical protein
VRNGHTLDGIVLARSLPPLHELQEVPWSGRAAEVADPGRASRLDAIVEHVAPGRAASVRPPSESELRATRVVALRLDEASAKVRTGPPKDDEADYALPVWAGELPLHLEPLAPVADPRSATAIPPPPHVTGWRRPRR